jgi:hypothetical protein
VAEELIPVSKVEVLKSFVDRLAGEIAGLTASARSAHQAATHEESKAEDRHDTFAIEASYLAAGQSARVLELERVRVEIEGYLAGSSRTDRVAPGCLVAYELEEGHHWVLMAKSGGGFRTQVASSGHGMVPVQILSIHSPLGGELLGLRAGDEFEVEIKNSVKGFTVLKVE